nr:GntR family transcriptional regulator [Acidobacteriota bacterium]
MRVSERVYLSLREDIIEWRLIPGTVLGEVEQSERLGVSRTPVREALSRGSTEVFSELAAKLRAAATLPDDGDPSRRAYYALVEQLDAQIDAACGNSYLAQALSQLRVHLVRVRRLARDHPHRLSAAALEHATI